MTSGSVSAFLRFVFERPTAYVIPEVRNPTAEVPHTRDLAGITSLHCMLWDKAILSRPDVEYIPSCNDYYLRSDESLIQFMRSPSNDESLSVGRIALATGWKGSPDVNPGTAPAIVGWYKSLSRWIKANFRNSFVYASDFKPDVGGRERMVWVGPGALQRSARGLKLKQNGPPEYSLHYFDPGQEESVLTRYREPRKLIGVGRVTDLGEVVSQMTRKRVYLVAFHEGAPFPEFQGPFMCFRPEPKLGDEVACLFSENIFGRHAEPWEPQEIKKITPKNRQRVLEGLRTEWRL